MKSLTENIKSFIIIIMVIALFLKSFRDNRFVSAAFYGLRPASSGLIAAAGLSVCGISLLNMDAGLSLALFNWRALALAAVLLVLTRYVKPTKKLHPIFFILFSAAVGMVFRFAGA